MMQRKIWNKKEVKPALPSMGQMVFCFMGVFSLFLILRNSEIAIDYMSQGMKLCTGTVIPSLFPFMVISELIVRSGVANVLSRILRLPMRFLFGIRGEGGSAFLLGTLCGFPIGTRVSVELYRNGKISKRELQKLICFSNNPSSAFIISAVGVSLFGSRQFGVALYFITLISAIIVGIILNIFDKIFCKKNTVDDFELINLKLRKSNGIVEFTEAITASAGGILNVCAFVIFFSAFVGTLGNMLNILGATEEIKTLLFAFFELTGGVSSASGLFPIGRAAALTALAVGWSGLSVHFQIISICDRIGISFRRYFISKLSQGLLNVILVSLYLSVLGDKINFDASSVVAFNLFSIPYGNLSVIINSIFVVFAFLSVRKKAISLK